jgi:alkylation response protein AidB-like acyl-CoA dehydrogenase
MQFDLTEEQTLIQQTARDYAKRVLTPRAAERDETRKYPSEELKQLADIGLFGINIPERYGGAEAGVIAFSLAMQELSYGDPSVAVAVSVTNMVAEMVAKYGTEAQKREHIPKLVDGSYGSASFALSEPEAGSDPAAMTCAAKRIDGGWSLTGTKQWITCGDRSGLIVLWAVTDNDSTRKGISVFLVRQGAQGLAVSKAEKKMGLHGSSTVQLSLDGVEVSDDDVLGEIGGGFKMAMTALDGGRIGISSQALGAATAAFDAALMYSQERVTFGVPIIRHQAIGNMLADCATWLEAGRLMTRRTAWLKENGKPFAKEASMTKLFSTEKACEICDIAIQIHGGYGFTVDFPVERLYRDVRVTRIYEGTSEIQRIVIARHLIKEIAA